MVTSVSILSFTTPVRPLLHGRGSIVPYIFPHSHTSKDLRSIPDEVWKGIDFTNENLEIEEWKSRSENQ